MNKKNLKKILIIGPKINECGILDIVKVLTDKIHLKYLHVSGGEIKVKDKIKLMFRDNKKIMIE